MYTSRLFLVGMLVLALLGLSGVAAATEDEVDEWWTNDPGWQTLDAEEKKYKRDLAKIEVDRAKAQVELIAITEGFWWWYSRFMRNTTYTRALQATNDQLAILDEKRETHMKKMAKELPRIDEDKREIETDLDRERKVKALQAAAKEASTEVGRWKIDPAKQGWKDKDVWFSVTCIILIAKGDNAGDESSRSTRGAHGAADLADKIKSAPNGCVPNKDYNTRLLIESWVLDSDGKREYLERVERDGADYQKP